MDNFGEEITAMRDDFSRETISVESLSNMVKVDRGSAAGTFNLANNSVGNYANMVARMKQTKIGLYKP